MQQCYGCLGILFGSNRRKRLRHLVKYKDDVSQNFGVEFENLMLDDANQSNYGTDLPIITQEEREFIAKRDYDKLLEEQKKVDEQINKELYEEEELLRVEDEAFNEAQREAARAASMTLSLKEKSASLSNAVGTSSSRPNSLTLDEVEDDFEDFLEEVRSRSIAFRSQYAKNAKEDTVSSSKFDRGGDGMSSDDEFLAHEMLPVKPNQQNNTGKDQEWAKYTSGVSQPDLKAGPPEKRLDPVGYGSPQVMNSQPHNKQLNDSDTRLDAAERMFSITDDEEDMGDFVHA